MYILEPYDALLEKILKHGVKKQTRTGVNTVTLFGTQSVYDISEYFPLLTRRKLSFRAIMGELVWFLRGQTTIKDLHKWGCKYWDQWGTAISKEGLEFYSYTGYPLGYLGPVYGWQLRFFGANYKNYVKDEWGFNEGIYNKGFDQLMYVIELVKNDKYSRKIVVNLWNAKDLHIMRLEPCLYGFQVLVDHEDRVNLILNQRSGDVPVGVPANLAFYAAFCYLIATEGGLRPGKLIHNIGDAHIYENQIEGVEEYLSRNIVNSPKLDINTFRDIYNIVPEDLELINYTPLPTIKIPVLV